MAIEIERKFLVIDDTWRADIAQTRMIRQVYLANSIYHSIRVRIVNDTQAWLTIKSGYRGISRDEFEYDVPIGDAVKMLELRQSGIIDKARYHVAFNGYDWEVDVFSGDNTGLIIAEVELENETQQPTKPPWVGAEVTGDERYQNSFLAAQPYSTWNLSR